ncbi:hypothetical protein D3C86_2097110 [compost metagenome]
MADISYTVEIDDSILVTEDGTENPSVDDGDTIFAGGDFRYNGEYTYNGERNYSSDSDILTIEIISV